MQQAILIMMHKNPEQVLRLLKYFPADRCACFIHVDKKLEIDVEVFQAEVSKVNARAFVIKKRISGILACWSLVQVSMELLIAAKQYDEEHHAGFRYYRLLAGQDYPIKTFAEYEDFLERNYPREFVEISPYDKTRDVQERFSRWRYSRPREIMAEWKGKKGVRLVFTALVHAYEVILTKLIGTPFDRLKKYGLKAAGGPSWWNITGHLADELIKNYTDEDNVINQVSRLVPTPEETYIQTVYINSALYDPAPVKNLTVGNYGVHGEPITGHTYCWHKEDFDLLRESNAFFARKFDPAEDCEILDLLDQVIYGNSESSMEVCD